MKEYIGFIQAMCSDKLYVNTVGDEPVTLTVKDNNKVCEMYCKHVRITVEEITEQEALKYQEEQGDST